MKILKLVVSLLLLTLVSSNASSSSDSTAARSVARAFEQHYQHTRSMTGLFLEKYTSGGSGITVESGKVYFEKPGRMRWDYDSPETKMFLVDGKNVWYYVPADHTASRTSVKESDDWRTPLALLAGKVKLERLCGSLSLANSAAANAAGKDDPEAKPSAPENSVLVCGPRKEDADVFERVLLEINPQHQLVRLSIEQPGAVEMEFRFGDWHENVPIDPAKFRFVPPKGVAIVDDAALAAKVQ
ncbi:MAG TPA: outer membrane lipoprotein carrier protein LolA [Verrucomicrobiae bacterium]|nr:outer membrane lipoprotein carrier protein LolA [Verrucomicrobiae bacterium]